MTDRKEIYSQWIEAERLLVTRLSGVVNVEDIANWRDGLLGALSELKPACRFKMFVNIHGFRAINIDAHKVFRNIVPLTLSNYGFRIGYLNMFKDIDLQITDTNGIICTAVAHAHHDPGKMELYERLYSKVNDRYFVDQAEARVWISRYVDHSYT